MGGLELSELTVFWKFIDSFSGKLLSGSMPKNQVLQESIGHLSTRPVGRPPNHVRRCYASFSYQAGSWDRKRRVVAKVEWRPQPAFFASPCR